jgi:hypothetical protein
MKFSERPRSGRLKLKWVALVAVAVVLAVAISYVDWWLVKERWGRAAGWKAAVVTLTAIEAAYCVSVPLVCLGIPVFGWRLWAGRRHGEARATSARLLIGFVSISISLLAAEAISAVWTLRSIPARTLPVDGRNATAREISVLDLITPPERIKLPTEFGDAPDDRDIDLVVVGESSAEGVPLQKWISIGKIIAWKLEQSIPERRVRLEVLARSGDTLEGQHRALLRLKRRPELLIVYCGHNEFQSRFFAWRDPDHYFAEKLPSSLDRVLARVERVSPLCGLIKRAADRCRVGIPPPPDRKRDLVDVPVYTQAEYEGLLDEFRRRLEAIVAYAQRVGALLVLIAPPANDADFEPNRSFLDGATPRAERDAFRADFRVARRLESVDRARAVERYRALVARQPCFAEAHFRLAQLLARQGILDEAYDEFVAARDLDGFPMRCLSSIQAVYHEVAARHKCILIDGQAYFHRIGSHGLLGDELFLDAMHPSLRGQIALAQAVLIALRAQGAFGWRQPSPDPIIDPADCAAHFGIGVLEWKVISAWGAGFYRLIAGLRYDDSERRRRMAAAEAAAIRIDAGIAPEALGLPNVGIPAAVPIEPFSMVRIQAGSGSVGPEQGSAASRRRWP